MIKENQDKNWAAFIRYIKHETLQFSRQPDTARPGHDKSYTEERREDK